MPKDVWSEDAVQRSIALQERSDAVAYDTTPRPEDIPKLVLVRRVSDSWVEAKLPDEAADLIASGDYRPFKATEGFTENGTLCCQADPEEVEFGRRERVAALARLMSGDEQERSIQDDLSVVETRIRSMSEEEIHRLEQSLIQPIAGIGAGLVRPAGQS